jgi:Glycosyl transferases group 1
VLERARYYERMERFNAASADLVLTVTDSERQALVSAGLDVRVEVLPNIHPSANTGGPWQTRHGLMFIGGFWHQPNEDAVCYFVDEVWPLIRRELPDIVFSVIGGHLSDRVSALASPSVRILGYVPDPSTYFVQSRVFVAPLRYGAGLKGKVGHSMSHGLPVVTTPIGAEGMMLEDETVLIASDAEAFAQAVVRLYSDEQLWSDLSRRSVEHIARHFSQEAALERLAKMFSLQSDADSSPLQPSLQRGPSAA